VGFVLSRRFWDVPGVRQFRVVQESLSETRVQVVAGDTFADSSGGRIAEMVREVLGAEVRVTVEIVDAIPQKAGGKTSYIQSRIAEEYL
jgi:phenylacetate-CoA ligase